MATLTINTTSAQDSRIAAAFGKALGTMTTDDPPVPRDATAAEVKASVIQFLKETVQRVEATEAAKVAVAALVEITPT